LRYGDGLGDGGGNRAEVDLDVGFGAGWVDLDKAALDSGIGGDAQDHGRGCSVNASGDVEGDAAESIAAHFGPRTVSVVDDHAGVGSGVWRNEKDSVGTDAEVSVAEGADDAGGRG